MRLCKYGNRPLLPKVSIKHVLSLVETVYFIIVRIREEKAQQCVSFQLQNFFWFIPKFKFWIACLRIKSKNNELLVCNKKTLATFTFKQRQEINIDGVVLRFYFWQNVRTSSIFVKIYLLSFSLEYSQHIFENHRGSLKQVADIVIRYQLLNRHFRRKELIGELLWTLMCVFKRIKLLLL